MGSKAEANVFVILDAHQCSGKKRHHTETCHINVLIGEMGRARYQQCLPVWSIKTQMDVKHLEQHLAE